MLFRIDLILALLFTIVLSVGCGAEFQGENHLGPVSSDPPISIIDPVGPGNSPSLISQNLDSYPSVASNIQTLVSMPGPRTPISNPYPAPLSPVVTDNHYFSPDDRRPVSNSYSSYNNPSGFWYVPNSYCNYDHPYYPCYSNYPYYSSNYYYRSGSLQILSSPYGASVYLNNKYRGRTPRTGYLDIDSLQPGTYDLLIQYDNYLPYTSTVFVERGQVRTINVVLNQETQPGPSTGSIQIQSEPADAQVFLNNQFMGITPVYLSDLALGDYTLTLQKEGYASYISVVKIVEGQTLPISAVLSGVPTQPPTPAPTSTPVLSQTPLPAPTRAGLPVMVVLLGIAAGMICISRR